jgi:hypothetical protein
MAVLHLVLALQAQLFRMLLAAAAVFKILQEVLIPQALV